MEVGKEFRPSPKLRMLYFTYLVIGVVLGVLTWYIPLLNIAPPEIITFITIPVATIIILIAIWIPTYYRSIIYKMTEDEIIWSRGVLIKSTGIVPYNRITNIDVTQGPIERMYGIATLLIHTAGYSGPRGPEIKLSGIENYEELKEKIMEMVKGRRPAAVETYEEGDTQEMILRELIKIRKTLERMLEAGSG